MFTGAAHNRRGAKARRLTKQQHGTSPSHENRQDHTPTSHQTQGQQGHNSPNKAHKPARPTLNWAEAIGQPPTTIVKSSNPTYHTVSQDAGCPFPFEPIPHLLLTGRYSGSTLHQNELVFRHIYPSGLPATRELLQSCRTEAHSAIRKRLGVNLMHQDDHGDIITVVTKKSEQLQGAWILTGDIRVRFPSSRAAISAYDQQRNQHNNRDPRAERLLTHEGQVSPTLIPSGHSNEASEDATLHRVHASCAAFRGKDAAGLLQLFRDSLSRKYENITALDTADTFQVPEDFYSALNDASDNAGDQDTVELDAITHLYLFEFSRITKTGGINSPFVTMEWPGIQIPQAILSNLSEKLLKIELITNYGDIEEHTVTFYERNPAGRGLDFTDNPDSKDDFLRYAVELQCLNPIADTRKTPLPPLEELAEGTTALIKAGLKHGALTRQDLDKSLKEAGTTRDWYIDKYYCEQDLSLNEHLGAAGAMSTGRVQDPEGAKTIILTYKTAAGAVAAIQRQTLKIVCFTDRDTGRLRVDIPATLGGKQDSSKQGRRIILIYKSSMHAGSIMNPAQCTQRTDRNSRQKWIITTLQQLEQYQPTPDPPIQFNTDADMGEQEQDPLHPEQEDPLQPEHPATGGDDHTPGQPDPTAAANILPQGPNTAVPPPTRISFGAPLPPRSTWETIATGNNRTRGTPAAPVTGTGVPLENAYSPLAQQGSGSNRDSEHLSFGSISGASGTHSSARNSRGRDPIPLTPEILHLLDRLEPDKGKQARLLTEHLTGQRSLPATEEELQTHLERRAAREHKRQQAAAEAAANKAAADQDRADHEAAMAAHMAQQAMASALAAGATNEEALAAGVAAQAAALGAGDSAQMLD